VEFVREFLLAFTIFFVTSGWSVVVERMVQGRVRRPDFYENLLAAHRRVVCVYVFVERALGEVGEGGIYVRGDVCSSSIISADSG